MKKQYSIILILAAIAIGVISFSQLQRKPELTKVEIPIHKQRINSTDKPADETKQNTAQNTKNSSTSTQVTANTPTTAISKSIVELKYNTGYPVNVQEEIQNNNIQVKPGWQVYIDPRFHYIIQYPKDWNVVTWNNSTTTSFSYSEEEGSKIFKARQLLILGYAADSYFEELYGMTLMYNKTFKFTDFSAKEYVWAIGDRSVFNENDFTFDSTVDAFGAEYQINRGEDTFIIKTKLEPNKKDVDLYEEIISTFGFLKDAPTGMKLWNTYKIKDLGISLSYPPTRSNIVFGDEGDSSSKYKFGKVLKIGVPRYWSDQGYPEPDLEISFLGKISYDEFLGAYKRYSLGLSKLNDPKLVKETTFFGKPAQMIEYSAAYTAKSKPDKIQFYRLINPPAGWSANHFIIYLSEKAKGYDKETMDKIIQTIKIAD